MSYTPAQMDAAVSALVAAIHGLHSDVARAWATAEQGVNYNILGVTYTDSTGQHLFKYSSWAQGAEAAANLIANSQYYGGIRASLPTGTSAQQAAAIIASPWNHPYYSTGAGAAMLRAIAGSVNANPSVRVLGPFNTYTRRTGGHTLRRPPLNSVYHIDLHTTWIHSGLPMNPLTDGPYKGCYVYPHGPLALSK